MVLNASFPPPSILCGLWIYLDQGIHLWLWVTEQSSFVLWMFPDHEDMAADYC